MCPKKPHKVRKEPKARKERVNWSSDEHDKYLQALRTYGKDFQKITDFVGTRDINSVRSYAVKLIKIFKKSATAEEAHLLTILEKPLQRGRKKAAAAADDAEEDSDKELDDWKKAGAGADADESSD